MSSETPSARFTFLTQLAPAFRDWWHEHRGQLGTLGTSSLLLRELWQFLRDSTPDRRRQRYGDMDFDWEHRVNTTSGTLGWRERLLGVFLSPYQPTDPALFDEMMKALPIDFREFTFIDLGSGKGRTLLMAAQYGFRRIIGVEIVPELHHAAEENVRLYRERYVDTRLAASQAAEKGGFVSGHRFSGAASPALSRAPLGAVSDSASPSPTDPDIECILADGQNYEFPPEPIVLYLFNPVSEAGLNRMIANLERSLSDHLRTVYVLYHNPLLEDVLASSEILKKVAGTEQFSVYANQA